MCGRFSQARSWSEPVQLYDVRHDDRPRVEPAEASTLFDWPAARRATASCSAAAIRAASVAPSPAAGNASTSIDGPR